MELKHSFSAAVPDQALTFKVGGWSETAEKPLPPMSVVLSARLYCDDEYAGIRDKLLQRRFKAAVVEGTSEEVVALIVEGRGTGDCRNMLRMYKPRQGAAIPENVIKIDVMLAVHECVPLVDAPHHYVASASRGALSVLWGKAEDVIGVHSRLPNSATPMRTVDVQLYVRGGFTRMSNHHAGTYLMRVSGFTGYFRSKV